MTASTIVFISFAMVVLVFSLMVSGVRSGFGRGFSLITGSTVVFWVSVNFLTPKQTLSLTLVFAGVVVFLWLGDGLNRKDARARVMRMGPPQMRDAIDLMAADPNLAMAGWLKDAWLTWPPEQRLTWVAHHMTALRDLYVDGLEKGFAAYGDRLPIKLAEIELIARLKH